MFFIAAEQPISVSMTTKEMEVALRTVARENKEVNGMLNKRSGYKVQIFVACRDDAFANGASLIEQIGVFNDAVAEFLRHEVSEPGGQGRVGILEASLLLRLAKFRAQCKTFRLKLRVLSNVAVVSKSV